jgi:hypothetical protein
MQVVEPLQNQELGQRLSRARAALILLLTVLLASVVLPMPDANGRILGLPSICIFYDLTGLPCPGCGLTRSFVSFAHGHLLEALRWNIFGPPLWLFFAFLCLRTIATLTTKKDIFPFDRKLINRSSIAAFAGLIIFDIIRIALLTAEHKHF